MTDGRLAFVFDDGYEEDYEDLRPVLNEADAPACFAIVPDWIGDEGHVSADQLATMADEGHEIVAHGRHHRYLAPHRLAADVEAGDDRAYVVGNVFSDGDHGVLVGDEYELTDGDRTKTVRLAGKGDDGDDGQYLEFGEGVDASFRAGETVVRPTEDVVRDEVTGTKADLRGLGFDPTSFVLPYDAADVRTCRIVREEYDALANVAVRSLPNPQGTPATDLRRYYLETDALTRGEIEEYLDDVADRDALGSLAGHGAWETVPAERVAFVVEAAREREIEITTLREVAEHESAV